MKVIIIEDEQLAAEKLSGLLQDYEPNIQILGRFDTAEEAVLWLNTHPAPDIIFLDIHLADGSGFRLFDLTTVRSPVVFTTAYHQYALEAFQVNSIGYLLKPITSKSLVKCMHKLEAMKAILTQGQLHQLQSLLRLAHSEKSYKTNFLVRSGEKIIPIACDAIAYFMVQGKYTLLVQRTGQQFLVDYTLEELEELLDPAIFFRLNRKFISSRTAISEIFLYFKGRSKVGLLPAPADEVIVSSEKNTLFKAWLEG